MSYLLYQTEGIVLSAWPRSEADRVLRLYTERYGGVTVMAKGVRLEKSKLRGDIELFCKTNIGFVVGKEVYRLTHAQVVDAYPRIRAYYERYYAAGFIAQMLRNVVADGEKDSALWELISKAFSFLASDEFPRESICIVLSAFELKLFRCLGYLPREVPRIAYDFLTAESFVPARQFNPYDWQKLEIFLRSIRKYVHQGVSNE